MGFKEELTLGNVGDLVYGESVWTSMDSAVAAVSQWLRNGGRPSVGWVARGEEMILVMDAKAAEDLAVKLGGDLPSLLASYDMLSKREPTQAEGDAFEHWAGSGMPPTGECFVPSGGWTGRRCRQCNRWVWGGPTACAGCAERQPR